MLLEIGGTPIFNDYKKGRGLNIKSDKQFCYYLNSGRNALNQVLDIEDIKKVYVCSYNCYTVIEPLYSHNIEVILYDVNRYFKVLNLFEKLNNESEKCAVIIQNYYATYYLDEIKHRLSEYPDVLVIEDITQSILDYREFVGADYYVGSIRKWSGTGEGGIIITDRIIDNIPKSDNEIIDRCKKIAPMQLEYINSRDQQLKADYRSLQSDLEAYFNVKYIQRINDAASEIIKSTDYEYIKSKRRDNFQYLLNKLKTLDCIKLPITQLNEQSVPLYLPIYADNRDDLQRFLFGYNIYLPILWGIYDKIQDELNEETRYIYNHILCVHIDQRYGKEDMDRIYNAIVDYYNKNK